MNAPSPDTCPSPPPPLPRTRGRPKCFFSPLTLVKRRGIRSNGRDLGSWGERGSRGTLDATEFSPESGKTGALTSVNPVGRPSNAVTSFMTRGWGWLRFCGGWNTVGRNLFAGRKLYLVGLGSWGLRGLGTQELRDSENWIRELRDLGT